MGKFNSKVEPPLGTECVRLSSVQYILFDGENISFDASLVLYNIYIYINSTNIPPIMITNRIYEHQDLLSL
jgi:hypothetical protein